MELFSGLGFQVHLPTWSASLEAWLKAQPQGPAIDLQTRQRSLRCPF